MTHGTIPVAAAAGAGIAVFSGDGVTMLGFPHPPYADLVIAVLGAILGWLTRGRR